MRIFEHMNMHGYEVCPICNKKTDKPVVLVGIDGTEEGLIMTAVQVHVDCLELRVMAFGEGKLIYQVINI